MAHEILLGLLFLGIVLILIDHYFELLFFGFFSLLGVICFGYFAYSLYGEGIWFVYVPLIFGLISLGIFRAIDNELFLVLSLAMYGLCFYTLYLFGDLSSIFVISMTIFLLFMAIISLYALKDISWNRKSKSKNGKELIGAKGFAIRGFVSEGQIRLRFGNGKSVIYEDWMAISSERIETGEEVEVIDVCGNVLKVKRK